MARSDFSSHTFIGSDAKLAKYVGRPVARFFSIEAAGGILLLLATAAALVWANSPWQDSYESFWHTEIEIQIGDFAVETPEGEPVTLEEFVNEGLMTLFFFVVGLEIKRELVTGQLRNPRDAMLPAFAALGGMVVPAVIFTIFNATGDGARGWGIPMATDIAFALGVVSLLGDRVSRELKVFLLTLAIVDDIGAILVIAIFYTEGLSLGWLLTAVVIAAAVWLLRQIRVWYVPIYVLFGVALVFATFESGVEATLSGVVLGLICPAKPLQSKEEARAIADWVKQKEPLTPNDIHRAEFSLRESVSVAERLENGLHPITSYIIVPLFALANAGVVFSNEVVDAAATSPVTWGVFLGLVLGKTIGVYGFTVAAERMGLASLPRAMTRPALLGLASAAGIGFTVSLFITNLAFETVALEDQAKIGILFASAVAAVVSLTILSRAKQVEPEGVPNY